MDEAQGISIWVMDTDLCEECGGLLDDFGICLDCGSDGIDWDEYEDTEEWETWADDG
jgi:hypothetical protein